jgi:uncharacterized glyoxalase superfamily metalloenzyme YdcJ
VVCFPGCHINHLTPRTLDIDRVQELMPKYGIEPKILIEGPPRARCRFTASDQFQSAGRAGAVCR